MGPVQQYLDQLDDFETHRPDHCPQCQARRPLTAHGFYTRTLADAAFDGEIRVRRYLCETCRRTVSLLPEFALPYLRSSITVIAMFLIARLVLEKTLATSLPPPRLTSGASFGCAASELRPRRCARRWPL